MERIIEGRKMNEKRQGMREELKKEAYCAMEKRSCMGGERVREVHDSSLKMGVLMTLRWWRS